MLSSLLYRGGKGLVLAALTVVFAAGSVLAQTGRVEGTVRDATTRDPIAGARVTIIGTALAATTNQNGYYALEDVPIGTHNMRVNIIGFQSMTITNQLVAAGLPTAVNFSLQASILRIEGIVVTGVAEATQAVKLAFTVDQVTTADMPVPAQSAEETLRGKVAGVKVIRQSGVPGSGVAVLLRGATSIDPTGRSNEPLYVVDGVILGASMVDIDALDIREIEVVKGAAASALFGARAANGVVSIKTNRGAALPEGETRVTFRSEFGRNDIAHRIPQAQSHWYAQDASGNWMGTSAAGLDSAVSPNDRAVATRNGWRMNIDNVSDSTDFDGDGTFTGHKYAISDNPYTGTTFDNLDRFFDPGSFYITSITISHRAANTNFLASFHETKESGIVKGLDGYVRRGARVNVDHNIGGQLDFSASAFFSQSAADDPQGGGDTPFYGLNFYPIDVDLLELDSLAQSKVDAGVATQRDSLSYVINPDKTVIEENPIYNARNSDLVRKRSRVLGSFTVRYRPTEEFDVTAAFSFDRSDRNNSLYYFKGFKSRGASDVNFGQYFRQNVNDQALNASLTAAYIKSFGDLNMVTKARVLLERQEGGFFDAQAKQLAVQDVQALDVGDQKISQIRSSQDAIRSLGYFLSTQMDYRDRYIIDALVRRDGSSLFGVDERWQWYYRLSGAYRMALEDWWPIDVLDEFKLRYSRGTAGGRPRFNAQYETYNVVGGAISPRTLGNKELKPEFATEQEFGIDMLVAGRISLSANYARSEVQDQILQVPLPGVFGFSSQWRNAGTLLTKSLEATLQAAIIQKADLAWNFNFVIDRTRQTITQLGVPAFRFGPNGIFFMREGEQLGRMWGNRWAATCAEVLDPVAGFSSGSSCLVSNGGGFQVSDDGFLVPVGPGNAYTDGIDQNLYGSRIELCGTDGHLCQGAEAGTGATYKWGEPFVAQEILVNPVTGQVDTTDFVPMGNTQPDFNFGIGQNFRYKGFSLYALFDAQIGGDQYNNTRQWAARELNAWEVDQGAKPANQRKPITYYATLYHVNANNSHFVEDATFLKFRELAVRYTFDQSQLEGVFGGFIKRMSLAVIGRNLHTWTGYLGYDPEAASDFDDIQENAGIFRFDAFGYPPFRTITGSIELEF